MISKHVVRLSNYGQFLCAEEVAAFQRRRLESPNPTSPRPASIRSGLNYNQVTVTVVAYGEMCIEPTAQECAKYEHTSSRSSLI